MQWLRIHISILFFLCAVSAAFGAENCCVPIRLDVVAKSLPGDRAALTIKLTNTGDKPLRFSNGFGPWAGPGQIKLVAIRLPGGELIDNQLRAMVEPALGPVDLAPGKSISHDVPIDEIYHELAVALREGKDDVVLFWTYELTAWDSKKSERLGGWLKISSRD